MDAHQTYCGNNFMMYVSQIIMLCNLSLYSAVCQLYLNKTGRKSESLLPIESLLSIRIIIILVIAWILKQVHIPPRKVIFFTNYALRS